jgi:hypothetical protein
MDSVLVKTPNDLATQLVRKRHEDLPPNVQGNLPAINNGLPINTPTL